MTQATAAKDAVLPASLQGNESLLILDIGTLVRLDGFDDVSLNGKTGTILKCENENDPSPKHYQVALDDPNAIDVVFGRVVRINAENLVPISFVESMTLQGFHIEYCTNTPFEITTTPRTSSSDSSTPAIIVFGGGPYNPSAHVDFLPREANLPTRKFAFHNEICEKFFCKMYNEGDFVVAWRFAHVEGKTEIKRRYLEFRFGFEERHVRECFPNENEFEQLSSVLRRGPFIILLRVNLLTLPKSDEGSSPVAYDLSELPIAIARTFGMEMRQKLKIKSNERIISQSHPNNLIPEIWNGGATDELFHARAYRLIHHVFRQRGAKLPLELSSYILDVVRPFDSPNDVTGKGTKKKMLEYLDLMVCRVDVEVTVLSFTYSDTLSKVGDALMGLEQYELAGRVYVWAAENFRAATTTVSRSHCWTDYMKGAIAYRRAKIIGPSEDCFVKALQWKYKDDGNRLLIHDIYFISLMKNMLSMYTYWGSWRQRRYY